MKNWSKLTCLFLMLLVITAGLFASGATQQQQQQATGGKVSRAEFVAAKNAAPPAPASFEISVLTISQTGDFIAATHPARAALERLTGYRVRLEYILNANYNESINTRLASRNLPGLIAVTGNTMPIVQAAQWGAFWDITEIYDLYPNLAKADKGVMSNISIEGRNYGIYRQRDWPRSGMIYREDWLQRLGLQAPKTLDELYNVLYAFTYNDPDGNGRQDTFGMNWTGAYLGPFYNLAVMHGAPNNFGVRNGRLTPWFEYDEFFEAMVYSKRLYDDGLINKDFAATSTGDWALAFGRGQAGFHIDVADEASRSAVRLRDNGIMTQAQFDQGALVGVLGLLANKAGQYRVWPQNDGHQGYMAVSTTTARNLTELHYYLDFMDKINSPNGITLLNWGVQDTDYRLVNGYAQAITGAPTREGLNQFRMLTTGGLLQEPNAYQRKHMVVYDQITPYAIVNPVTPIALMSPTWTSRSSSLNTIINDAVVNFIMGNINQAGFRTEVQRWYSEGGTQALSELQAAYDASR
ncbi:MAG: extracellular solute-binding protein [Treponema sp.]|nr:extracellular solute-binding protein [Treponema sp.]